MGRGGLGWSCPPHFCQRSFLRLMQIRRVFFEGWGLGVASQRTGTAAVNVSFCSAPPFTCLLFTNDPMRIWTRCHMCAKVISISYTCWATYNNQKMTPKQEVHKFYPFQALFLAYWGGFKNIRLKWHIFPLIWVVQRQNAFSFRRAKGFVPWSPPDPVIGSRSTLAMSPTRAFCPLHCFRPGDALPKSRTVNIPFKIMAMCLIWFRRAITGPLNQICCLKQADKGDELSRKDFRIDCRNRNYRKCKSLHIPHQYRHTTTKIHKFFTK